MRIVGDTLVLCEPLNDVASGSPENAVLCPPFRDAAHWSPAARAAVHTQADQDNDSTNVSSSMEELCASTNAEKIWSRTQRSTSPRRRSSPQWGSPRRPAGSVPMSLLRRLCGSPDAGGELGEADARAFVEEQLFTSLPRENIANLEVQAVGSERSRRQFIETIQKDSASRSEGSSAASLLAACTRVKTAWHLPGSDAAAASIIESGIRCDEDACACGRYGRGGYVALTAAKANAYADASGEGGTRKLFMVFALPDENVVKGERGVRPAQTAADLPSHPTEYCFVNPARLHCVYLITFTWVPTGRREKVVTAGARVSHIVPPSPPCRRRASKCALLSRARRCQPRQSSRLGAGVPVTTLRQGSNLLAPVKV
jgi:hypothetical protein